MTVSTLLWIHLSCRSNNNRKIFPDENKNNEIKPSFRTATRYSIQYSNVTIYAQSKDSKSCLARKHIGRIQVIFQRLFSRLLSSLCYMAKLIYEYEMWVPCRKDILAIQAHVVGSCYIILSRMLNRIPFRFPTYGGSSNDMRIMHSHCSSILPTRCRSTHRSLLICIERINS